MPLYHVSCVDESGRDVIVPVDAWSAGQAQVQAQERGFVVGPAVAVDVPATRAPVMTAPPETGLVARVAGIVMVVLGLGLAGWGLFELTRPASVGDTARELERFARAMYGFQAITGGLGLAFMGGVLAGIGGIQQSIGRWAAWHAHATR